jgi:hypothetical protein
VVHLYENDMGKTLRTHGADDKCKYLTEEGGSSEDVDTDRSWPIILKCFQGLGLRGGNFLID